MEENLIKLHSSRAKLGINFSIIVSVSLLYIAFRIGSQVFKTIDNSHVILILLIPILIISCIWYYFHAFLGYLDLSNNQVIFKKPFRKKEWIVKLENISVVDTVSFPIISRAKHIKVTFKNKNGKMSDYYLWKSSKFMGLGGDEDEILFDAVLKRKQELLSSESL
ncbi:hypothetical protein [Aquimarina aquimarini]|uniref:hypothetical protein n=1 Tax=Aquimarina aquimarini TaxID=1191734 RepID=UPI000D55877E|nr:hypothetical protein [Aquimarina aquimarini]